jgi:hypothetical protein
MKFVAHKQSAEPVQPAEQPFYDPTRRLRRSALRLALVLAIGRNHFDSVLLVKKVIDSSRKLLASVSSTIPAPFVFARQSVKRRCYTIRPSQILLSSP